MKLPYEKFFRRPVEGSLPPEVFCNDDELRRSFIRCVSKPGWIQEQRAWARKQEEQAGKDSRVNEQTYPKLAGSQLLSSLEHTADVDIATQHNTLALPATRAFHFLEMDTTKIPSQPGEYASSTLHTTSGEVRSRITPMLLKLEERFQNDMQWVLSMRTPYESDISAMNPRAVRFLDALGLGDEYQRLCDKKYSKHWQFALRELIKIIQERERFAYSCFVIDTAITDITQMIPGWKKLAQSVKERAIVHIFSHERSEARNSSLSGKNLHISLTQSKTQPPSEIFMQDYLVSVHEFSHAFINARITQESPKTIVVGKPPLLMGVLQEGGAISLEQAVIQLYRLDSSPKLPSWAKTRLLRTITTLKKSRNIALEDIGPVVHYAEGVRFGRRMAVQGKRIEDLPAVLDSLVQNALRITGSKDPSILYRIPVSSKPESLYQKIVRQTFGVPGQSSTSQKNK